jgi:transcriptional regulator with XRE-family HTH domain
MLSQQELADRAGVSLFTVQRIERGEGGVRPKTGRAIAAALDVGVEDLLGKAQAPLPDFEVERGEATYDIALDAARQQAEYDRLAANRTLASDGIPQPAYFKDHENAAVTRLRTYPADELAYGLIEMARQVVELEGPQDESEGKRATEERREAETIRSASA